MGSRQPYTKVQDTALLLLRLVVAAIFLYAGSAKWPFLAELWFDDVEAILHARRLPEWAASTADEVYFADPDSERLLRQ